MLNNLWLLIALGCLSASCAVASEVEAEDFQVWVDVGGVSEKSLAADPAAARFTILPHPLPPSSITSDVTYFSAYADTSCTTLLGLSALSGSYTFDGGSRVQYYAESAYYVVVNNLGLDSSTVQSVSVEPYANNQPVFTSSSCFSVTCSAVTGLCMTSNVAIVSLNDG